MFVQIHLHVWCGNPSGLVSNFDLAPAWGCQGARRHNRVQLPCLGIVPCTLISVGLDDQLWAGEQTVTVHLGQTSLEPRVETKGSGT